MADIRFGVVGCGVIHSTHCDAIKQIDGAKLAAVCDIIPIRAKDAGTKYGVPSFTRLAPMLEKVDAVCLCVPSGLHAKIGIAAARAGKHVLSEKPIDVSAKAAETLVAECKKAGVKLACISQHRFAQAMRRLHDAAQSGELGRLICGDAYIKWYRTQAYYDSGDWRGTKKLDGGGCLMNQGVHYVDMIQWVMGGVKSVQADVRTTTHQIEVEDVANALIEFKNGATGVIQGSTSCFPGMAERLEVHGEYGSVTLEGDEIRVWEMDPNAPKDKSPYGRGVTHQPTPSLPQHPGGASPTGASDPTAIWGEQHRLQIEDFVRAIVDNRDPYLTGEEAVKPLKVILGVYKSSRLGGRRVLV